MDYNLAQQLFFDSEFNSYQFQYAPAHVAQIALLKEVCLSPNPV